MTRGTRWFVRGASAIVFLALTPVCVLGWGRDLLQPERVYYVAMAAYGLTSGYVSLELYRLSLPYQGRRRPVVGLVFYSLAAHVWVLWFLGWAWVASRATTMEVLTASVLWIAVIPSLGQFLFTLGRRLRQPALTPEQLQDGDPFVLYLRAFLRDRVSIHRDTTAVHNPVDLSTFGGFVPLARMGEVIRRGLADLDRVVAVGCPQDEIPALGPGSVWLAEEEWRDVVAMLARKAIWIVLMPDEPPGILWELEHARCNHWDKLVLLLPPVNQRDRALGDPHDFARLWRYLRKRVLGRGPAEAPKPWVKVWEDFRRRYPWLPEVSDEVVAIEFDGPDQPRLLTSDKQGFEVRVADLREQLRTRRSPPTQRSAFPRESVRAPQGIREQRDGYVSIDRRSHVVQAADHVATPEREPPDNPVDPEREVLSADRTGPVPVSAADQRGSMVALALLALMVLWAAMGNAGLTLWGFLVSLWAVVRIWFAVARRRPFRPLELIPPGPGVVLSRQLKSAGRLLCALVAGAASIVSGPVALNVLVAAVGLSGEPRPDLEGLMEVLAVAGALWFGYYRAAIWYQQA